MLSVSTESHQIRLGAADKLDSVARQWRGSFRQVPEVYKLKHGSSMYRRSLAQSISNDLLSELRELIWPDHYPSFHWLTGSPPPSPSKLTTPSINLLSFGNRETWSILKNTGPIHFFASYFWGQAERFEVWTGSDSLRELAGSSLHHFVANGFVIFSSTKGTPPSRSSGGGSNVVAHARATFSSSTTPSPLTPTAPTSLPFLKSGRPPPNSTTPALVWRLVLWMPGRATPSRKPMPRLDKAFWLELKPKAVNALARAMSRLPNKEESSSAAPTSHKPMNSDGLARGIMTICITTFGWGSPVRKLEFTWATPSWHCVLICKISLSDKVGRS